MKQQTMPANEKPASHVSPETLELARKGVRALLTKSDSFAALSPEARQQLTGHMVDLVAYLAEPEGIKATQLPVGGEFLNHAAMGV